MVSAAPSQAVAVTDESEMEQFVQDGYPVLVAALALVCGSRDVAEDAVQEALTRAVLARRRGRPIDALAPWVRVVALNVLKNRWRSMGRERSARRRLHAEGAARSEAPPAHLEDNVDLIQAVGGLSPRQREAVVWHYLADLSVAETAELMGVTQGTVKTLLSRARQALAATMGEEVRDG